MADTRVAGERFAFDEDVWAEEVGRFTRERPGLRERTHRAGADRAAGRARSRFAL